MEAEQFTVRLARPDDDQAIAALVVEGFMDQFRHVFGGRMDRAIKIMERWVCLEHASGGVRSLVVEGYADAEIAGSIGVRTEVSREDILARGLWRSLTRNLGIPRAVWATTCSHLPTYSSVDSEATQRLWISPSSGDREWAAADWRQKTDRARGKKTWAASKAQTWRPATLRGGVRESHGRDPSRPV